MYPFDETFAAGIPSGFAAAGGYGSVTASWNATEATVDLVFGQQQNFWKLTAAEPSTDFWLEVDLEITAAAYTPPHFGFWLWDGNGAYEGHRIAVWNLIWLASAWTAAGAEFDGGSAGLTAEWATVGARRVLRLDVRKHAQGDYATVALSINGTPALEVYRRYYPTFLPGIFGYGVNLRIHRITGGIPSTLAPAPALAVQRLPVRVARRPLAPEHLSQERIGNRGLPVALGRRRLVPEHAGIRYPNSRGYRLGVGIRNAYYAGAGQIVGTVKEKGVPTDLPLQRKVVLLDETTQILVRETWSDATTGVYAFAHVDPTKTYTVIAYDYRHNYRAVIADRLVPEAMP